jgi:hypothetical protein
LSEETFPVALAGRRWELPHLPFRAIKAIQPLLFHVYVDAGGEAITTQSIAALGEAQIERLAEATWKAIAQVDPALTYEAFIDLPFTVGDLILTFPSVAQAAGLRAKTSDATSEASPAPGKSISTR